MGMLEICQFNGKLKNILMFVVGVDVLPSIYRCWSPNVNSLRFSFESSFLHFQLLHL